jgi:predicted transposase YdaD
VLGIPSSARRPRSLHDQVFKGLIGAFLPDFVTLVAPETAAQLDFTHWKLLDKEAFTDWPQGRRRELDLLAEVALAEDSGQTILIHVEIEARARPETGRRLAGYDMQIQLRHGRPVVPFLLNLRRGRPGIHLETVVDDRFGPEIGRFCYYSLGLEGCSAEEFLARDQPLAWALAALMRSTSMSRAEHKMACLRRIAAARLDDLGRFLLVNCVETYLKLEGRDAEEMVSLQARDEEARAMRAIRMTWAEELLTEGMEKGIEKGRQQGLDLLRQTLVRQLGLRFGPLSEEAKRRIEAISSVERLSQIADQILLARSLEEILP